MHQLKDELPVRLDSPNAKVQATAWNGMLAEYMQFSAGTDLTPLLEGLPNDKCPCLH